MPETSTLPVAGQSLVALDAFLAALGHSGSDAPPTWATTWLHRDEPILAMHTFHCQAITALRHQELDAQRFDGYLYRRRRRFCPL